MGGRIRSWLLGSALGLLLTVLLMGCNGDEVPSLRPTTPTPVTVTLSATAVPTAAATPTPTAGPTPTPRPTPTPTEDPILARLRAHAGEPGGCRWLVARGRVPLYPINGRDIYVLACTPRDLKDLDENFDTSFIASLGISADHLLPAIWFDPKEPDYVGFNYFGLPDEKWQEDLLERFGQPPYTLEKQIEMTSLGGRRLPRPIVRVAYNMALGGLIENITVYPNGIVGLPEMLPDATQQGYEIFLLRYNKEGGRYEVYPLKSGDTWYVYLTGVMAESLPVRDPYLTYFGMNPEAVQPFVVGPAFRGLAAEYVRDLRVRKVHLLCVFPEGVYEPRPLREPPEMALGFILWGREVPSTGVWGPGYAQAAVGLPLLRSGAPEPEEVPARERWRILARDLARSRPLQVLPFREALAKGALPYGDIYRPWFEGRTWGRTVQGFLRGYAPGLYDDVPPWTRSLPTWWTDLPDLEERGGAYPFDPPIPSPYEDAEGDGWEWYVLWLPEDRAVLEGLDDTLTFLFQVFPRYPMQWERRRDMARKVSSPAGGWAMEPTVDLEQAVRTAWMGCLPVGEVTYVDGWTGETVGPRWMPGVESVYRPTGSFFRQVTYYPRPEGMRKYWLHPADLVRPLLPGILRGVVPEGTFARLDEGTLNLRDYRDLRAHAHLLVPWYPAVDEWVGLPPVPPRDALPPVLGLEDVLRARPWFLDPEFYLKVFGG